MLKIAFMVTTHGRHALAADSIRRVVDQRAELYAAGVVEFRPLVVMSIEDVPALAKFCRDLGVDWITAVNNPVSNKHQTGVAAVRAFDDRGDLDGIMYAGSDDFLSDAYIRRAVAALADGSPGVGPATIWFLDAPTRRLGKWQGPMSLRSGAPAPAGAGRLISRKILDATNWIVWPFRRNSGLDSHSSTHLEMKGFHLEPLTLPDDEAIVDIKTEVNIHSWKEFEHGNNFCEVITGPRRDAICQVAGVPDAWYRSAP